VAREPGNGLYCCFHGKLEASESARWELKAVARQGHVFSQRCPGDVALYRKVSVDYHQILQDFFIHFCVLWFKEPLPTLRFLELLGQCTGEIDDVGFVRVLLQVLEHVDDEPEAWVHAQISRKRMAFTMGFTTCLRHLGILHDTPERRAAKLESARKKRQRVGDGELGEADGECHKKMKPLPLPRDIVQRVKLGPIGTEYDAVACTREVSYLRQGLKGKTLRAVNGSEDVDGFVSDFKAAVRSLHPPWNLGGDYLMPHFLRKPLLVAEAKNPAILDSFTKANLLEWSPDNGGFLAYLPSGMRLGELRSLFGHSALMISCWCCLVHECADLPCEKYFDVGSREFGHAMEQLAAQHDGFEPHPTIAVQHLLDAAGPNRRVRRRPAAR